MSSRVVVTGGAGFIGRNLCEKLINEGNEVVVLDNLSTGHNKFIEDLEVEFYKLDVADPDIRKNNVFKNTACIYHLAADIDNRLSWQQPDHPVRSNIQGTLNIALAAHNFEIPKIVYASSSTIYGEHLQAPYNENDENSRQTSLYGATKYAAEGVLSTFAFHFGIKIVIFRFGNVLGPFCSHGHLFDFVKSLKRDASRLTILGDGNQVKTFVNVSDVVKALRYIEGSDEFSVFNLSRRDFSSVKDSVRWLCEELGINPELSFGSGKAGWKGDNPNLFLNTVRIESQGWKPEVSIQNTVKETVRWLWENDWIFALKD